MQHLREEQRLDQASVKELVVNAVPADEIQFQVDEISVTLVNDGPHPVSVVSARVTGGLPVPVLIARTNTIPPNGTQTLRFRRPACPDSLPGLEGAGLVFGLGRSELRLTVRTYRGETAEISLSGQDAVSSVVSSYYSTMIDHCRLYPPATSLVQAGAITTVRQGSDLLVTVTVRNRSKRARTLQGIWVSGGLSVVSATHDLEFVAGATHRISLTLRATACTRALRAWGSGFDGIALDSSSSSADLGSGIVTTVVSGDGQRDARGFLLGAGFSGQGITPWVLAVCAKK